MKVFISDCEGPISKNDNAFEATAHFVPNGDKLFEVISKYDDVLSDVLQRANHKAGDTLKLILPFLKAYDVTDKKMREFSAQNLALIANIKDSLQHVRRIAHPFIVSTSYEHYIKALCHAIDFPYENAFCTRVSIDRYLINNNEKRRLKELAQRIVQMSILEIPPEATSLIDFLQKDKGAIRNLDAIFWDEIANMEIGKAYSEVNPVGGREKAEAVEDAVNKAGAKMADVIYVGDSITDVEALRLVKENGGLAVSFNGNQYAVENAEIAVLSENSIVTAIIADIFYNFGRQETLRLMEDWSQIKLIKSPINAALIKRLFNLYPEKLPKVKIITKENMEILVTESNDFRKRVRGEIIGRLG